MGVILALQSSDAVHVGVDNLNEVRHVGRLLDGRSLPVTVIFFYSLRGCFFAGGLTLFGSLRLRVMLMRVW